MLRSLSIYIPSVLFAIFMLSFLAFILHLMNARVAIADIAEARLVPDEAELKASLKAAKGK